MIYLFILLLIILLDQVSKHYIRGFLGDNAVVVVSDFFNLTASLNTGISFGLFTNLNHANTIFICVNTIIVCGLFVMLFNSINKSQNIGLSLVLGGAIANLIDRFFYNAVYDFIDIHIYSLHWPIFNVADIAVVIGVSVLLLGEVVSNTKRENK